MPTAGRKRVKNSTRIMEHLDVLKAGKFLSFKGGDRT